MASVSSLDSDMRKLRMSRYTPQAAKEVRQWIEETLSEQLPAGDLLDALKDGAALCKLANLAIPPPGIKFKKSPMPFIQMENISHFLRACELPPLSLPSHDRFLTVDLYESKDPAQVLQCLVAFSRVANLIAPNKIPTTIGPKKSAGTPTGGAGVNGGFSAPSAARGTGTSNSSKMGSSTFDPTASSRKERALSPALTGGSNSSRTTEGTARSPQGPVSSWSKKSDEGMTAPAWNIHQYGYMGGASQGNQGITFGGRRQITSAAPLVPNLAEKERKRREKEAEEEARRLQEEEEREKQRQQREAEEQRARLEEERRWEAETRKQREDEKRRVDMQKMEWEEQERKWREEEARRNREEEEANKKIERETQRKQPTGESQLRGQYLSEYQAEQTKPRSRKSSFNDPEKLAERERIRELEQQLAEAKERERQYQLERAERPRSANPQADISGSDAQAQQPPRPPSPRESEVSWAGDEREYTRQHFNNRRGVSRPLPDPSTVSSRIPSRPLPDPTVAASATSPEPPISPRPLPDPTEYKAPAEFRPAPKSKSPFAAIRTTPSKPQPAPQTQPHDSAPQPAFSSPSPSLEPPSSPLTSPEPPLPGPTKPLKWGKKPTSGPPSPAKSVFARPAGGSSLLNREMERERQRQREWEDAQKATAAAPRDATEGSGAGQTWDVHQYGYVGGDNQNRGGAGIAFGGRRQIIGPRPRP